jgi:PKD repeat protein
VLRISGGQNAFGGLDVSATGGALTAGANNQLVNGEITHKAPQLVAGGVIDFPFTWTAPTTLGTVTLYGAGVSADGNALNSGDADVAATLAINVTNNLAPVANAGGPYMARATVAIDFDGSGSKDDGTIKTYAWDYGDGAAGTGVKSTHAYAKEGTYNVKLTVTDDGGLTGSATTTATILPATNTPPVASAGGPYVSLHKKRIAFDGSGSKDADGTIVSYSWDFGDGATGTGAKPTHRYGSAGMFNITLTVTDNDGATAKATTTVKIGP